MPSGRSHEDCIKWCEQVANDAPDSGSTSQAGSDRPGQTSSTSKRKAAAAPTSAVRAKGKKVKRALTPDQGQPELPELDPPEYLSSPPARRARKRPLLAPASPPSPPKPSRPIASSSKAKAAPSKQQPREGQDDEDKPATSSPPRGPVTRARGRPSTSAPVANPFKAASGSKTATRKRTAAAPMTDEAEADAPRTPSNGNLATRRRSAVSKVFTDAPSSDDPFRVGGASAGPRKDASSSVLVTPNPSPTRNTAQTTNGKVPVVSRHSTPSSSNFVQSRPGVRSSDRANADGFVTPPAQMLAPDPMVPVGPPLTPLASHSDLPVSGSNSTSSRPAAPTTRKVWNPPPAPRKPPRPQGWIDREADELAGRGARGRLLWPEAHGRKEEEVC